MSGNSRSASAGSSNSRALVSLYYVIYFEQNYDKFSVTFFGGGKSKFGFTWPKNIINKDVHISNNTKVLFWKAYPLEISQYRPKPLKIA